MGYAVQRTLFEDVRYNTKTTPEVREAMVRKVEAIRALIAEREVRIERVRDEHSIDAEQLAILVMRYKKDAQFVSYERQGTGRDPVPAGVIANLVREQEMIDSEQHQIWKLELVLRNLRDEEMYLEPRTGQVKVRPSLHQLDDQELEYLGF